MIKTSLFENEIFNKTYKFRKILNIFIIIFTFFSFVILYPFLVSGIILGIIAAICTGLFIIHHNRFIEHEGVPRKIGINSDNLVLFYKDNTIQIDWDEIKNITIYGKIIKVTKIIIKDGGKISLRFVDQNHIKKALAGKTTNSDR